MSITSYMPPVGLTDPDRLFDAVCVVGKDGRYRHVNAAFERIFGYAPQEVIGLPMMDLVLPEDRAHTIQVAEQVMAGSSIPRFENRYMHKDGRIVTVQWSACWSEQHQTRIGIAHDVTARRRSAVGETVLGAISDAALHADDLLALFARVHRIVEKLLPASSFTVVLRGERAGAHTVPYHVAVGESTGHLLSLVAERLGDQTMFTGQPILLTPGKLAVWSMGQHVPAIMYALSWLAVPLSTQQGIIGSLVLTGPDRSRPYGESDKELLHFVSTQVATAVESKQFFARLLHLSGGGPAAAPRPDSRIRPAPL
jgi:PAS domain S-box-containing protein